MNMTILDMRDNPVAKQHKLRDYVALMSPTLSTLDGREITQVLCGYVPLLAKNPGASARPCQLPASRSPARARI